MERRLLVRIEIVQNEMDVTRCRMPFHAVVPEKLRGVCERPALCDRDTALPLEGSDLDEDIHASPYFRFVSAICRRIGGKAGQNVGANWFVLPVDSRLM